MKNFDSTTVDAKTLIAWFEYLRKELGLPKVAEENENDIIQERSPLEPFKVVLRHLWFEENLGYYKEIKTWIKKNHPKVFVTEGQSDVYELFDAVTIYFTTRELYMEFINKWPKVLRGSDEE